MLNDKWDERFLKLANHVSTWSKDPSTKVGAVLVSPDRSGVVLGYNGFPRGVEDYPYQLADKDKKYERIVHAELNAILNSGRDLSGWTLYVYPYPPCCECAKAIIQSGIKRVVFPSLVGVGEKWLKSWKVSKEMFEQAGVSYYE